MSVRSDYDVWHRRIVQADPNSEEGCSPWYLLVREALGQIAGLQVLEVACGRCGFARQLVGDGAQVTGCDFSSAALAVGRERLNMAGVFSRGAWLVQGDVQRLPFAEASYDAVISCETIEHVPDPLAALCEMYRIARPGACLYMTTPNYLNVVGLHLIYAAVRHPGRKSAQPIDRRYLFPQVRRLVRRAGWEVVHSDGTVHQFPILPGRRPFRINALETNRWVRRLLSPFALHYFLIAKKP